MGNLKILDDNEEVKRWVQFDEDTEVCIVLLDRAALRNIANKANKAARTGADATAYTDVLLGRNAVRGWRNMNSHEHPGLTVNGQPFPYSQENCDLLMKKNVTFNRFVNDACLDEHAGEEEDTKNG